MEHFVEDEVDYYYDSHPTKEDLMGVTVAHTVLIRYLISVLEWLLREQVCAIHENLNFYQTSQVSEYPVAPDIAVIKGVARRFVTSWRVGRSGPAPQVVFEIASKETWQSDLFDKPGTYARMGVREYFTYDPNEPPVWRPSQQRLRGWRLEESGGQSRELQAEEEGWLWSEELESWLVPDGFYLRLFDREQQMRLTEAEAKDQVAQIKTWEAEANKRLAESKAQEAESKTREAEANKRLAESKAQEAESKTREAEANKRLAERNAERAEALAQRLRELGINPDEI